MNRTYDVPSWGDVTVTWGSGQGTDQVVCFEGDAWRNSFSYLGTATTEEEAIKIVDAWALTENTTRVR